MVEPGGGGGDERAYDIYLPYWRARNHKKKLGGIDVIGRNPGYQGKGSASVVTELDPTSWLTPFEGDGGANALVASELNPAFS